MSKGTPKQLIFHFSLGPLIEQHHPRVIVETGTHSGRTAHFMCSRALQYHNNVEYHGFDLFDQATNETHSKEINGKGTGSFEKAFAKLSDLKRQYSQFNFELHRGFTTNSFVTPIKADLVYIDGGHSTETVLHDYSMVKDSAVIVFDDFQMESVQQAVRQIGIFDQVQTLHHGKTAQAIYIRK
jgi:hypothetical protein